MLGKIRQEKKSEKAESRKYILSVYGGGGGGKHCLHIRYDELLPIIEFSATFVVSSVPAS